MQGYAFNCPQLLRFGCLGMLLILIAGILVRPRPELKPVWVSCLGLAGFQAAITLAYVIKFPYSCNQNMRFLAQAFVPFACLLGLGFGHFWHGAGRAGRGLAVVLCGVFLTGLCDFYFHLLSGR
jgi:hypothetical protein